MTTPSATFAVRLSDQTSAPARTAVSALEALKTRIQRSTAEARLMNSALVRLKAGGLGASAAAQDLRGRLAGLRVSAAQAQAELVGLGGHLEDARPPTSAFEAFVERIAGAGGPLGSMAQGVGRLRTAGPVAIGVLALATAVVGVIAAAVAGARALIELTAQVVRFGVASADARRSEELHIEGLTRMRHSAAFASMGSSEVMAAIDRVSTVAAIGRSEVAGYAEQLYRAGVRGRALDAALEGVSITAAAAGSGAASRFLGMSIGAARAGRDVRRLTDDVRARFGDVNARMNLSLDRQATRLRESFAALFGGSRVSAALERFLQRIGEIQGLFSQSSATGRALRQIVEAIFPAMLDDASALGPVVRRLFQQLTINALDAAIVFVRVRREVRSLWREVFGGLDVGIALEAAFSGAGLALLNFPAYLLTVAARLNVVFMSMGLRFAGYLVDGLVGGIRAHVREAGSAVEGLALGVAARFRDALGIHSPSRVFAEYGRHVAGGLAEGVESGAPAARAAVEEMAGVPAAGAVRGAAPSIAVSIDQIVVQSQATDARGIAADIRDALADALEGLGLELGAPA